LDAQLNIRMPNELAKKLTKVARRLGLKKSDKKASKLFVF